MKRMLLVTIICCIMCITFCVGVSSEATFTPEEAIRLFEDAEILYATLERADSGYAEIILDMTNYKDNYDESKLEDKDKKEMYRHYKVLAYKFRYGSTEIVIDTRSDLEKLISLYFTEKVSKEYINSFTAYFSVYPFRNEVAQPLYIDEYDNVYHLCDAITYQIHENYQVVGYTDFKCGDTEATINLTLRRTRVPQDDEYLNIPVEFEKTESGWRMSEDIFNNVLHYTTGPYDGVYRNYLIPNPNTSDSTPIIITLLTLSGIVLACVPLVKKKRMK